MISYTYESLSFFCHFLLNLSKENFYILAKDAITYKLSNTNAYCKTCLISNSIMNIWLSLVMFLMRWLYNPLHSWYTFVPIIKKIISFDTYSSYIQYNNQKPNPILIWRKYFMNLINRIYTYKTNYLVRTHNAYHHYSAWL